jgi:hypothetical protein
MIHINHLAELIAMACTGLFFTSVGFAALWVRARERATRAESLLEGMRMMGARDGSSTALDAIAEEVERIGEGQRFITRIMSEGASRAEQVRPRSSATVTPH